MIGRFTFGDRNQVAACLVALCCLIASATVCAQDAATATLHVYTNLIQIPVLVVDKNHETVAPIPESRFLVSLDSGKPFHPKHVRREADDVIRLAILIDYSDDPTWMRTVAPRAIAAAIPTALEARDHVSVYTLNCHLYREFNDVASDDLSNLENAVELSVHTHDEPHAKHPACEQRVHLWDAVGLVTRKLGELPGRRVVLVISDGGDHGSHHTWNEVRQLAVERSVAIFGLNSDAPVATPTIAIGPHQLLAVRPEDSLRSLCELTGGLVLFAERSEKEVGRELTRLVGLVRGRYIVEFPRLDSMTPGAHDILVTVAGRDLVIRPAGDVATIADRTLLADPMTIPPEPDERESGGRKVLSPNKE